MSTPIIRIVIVDDSAFVRKIVKEMLSRSPFLEVVGIARDGEEALGMVATLKPDVVTCDLAMPGNGGIGFVREQFARNPMPIVILSSSSSDSEQVLEAMSAGAVDFVQKPTALATEDLLKIRDELVSKIRGAAGAPVRHLQMTLSAIAPPMKRVASSRVDAVVLGISTGGPQALRYLVPQFPEDFPVPIVIVLHMPVGYTALFATKLNEISKVRVSEANDGGTLLPGTATIAQAGRHLVLERSLTGDVVARLRSKPLDKLHRPSVDVLFKSAADVYGPRLLGVVMTGMGDDGKEGAAWIKAQGGSVITQGAASCIIYGMPRSVVEAGLSDLSVPLTHMAGAIMNYL